jgi:hypothetical protein
MKKYGKPIEDILDHKTHFWKNNDAELEKRRQVAEVYSSQPERVSCKICCEDIENTKGQFEKMGVEYRICGECGHLNGLYEDTEEFVDFLYSDDGGVDYSGGYIEETRKEYQSRVSDIYLPKAEFLYDTLRDEEEVPTELTYADLGAGAGYMMTALENQGAQDVEGYEVSASQVRHAKAVNEELDIHKTEQAEIYNIAKTVEADVITMIGVLEHLRYPRDMVQSLDDNPDVEYVFCSLPMFSPSVFFEMVSSSVMPRQLTSGHTHLFQDSSIDELCDLGNFTRQSEWWFGQDMIDMVRLVEVSTRKQSASDETVQHWKDISYDMIDDLQEIMDRKHRSSECHILLQN